MLYMKAHRDCVSSLQFCFHHLHLPIPAKKPNCSSAILEAHTRGTALPDFSSKIKVSPPASSTKSSPYKNISLTVAQHFPARRKTLSCMYKNILLSVAQDFMAQYRLFCKHTTHKNTIELFSNIETCFTIFLPFVVHSLIIIFYKGLNFVYFPVI